VPVPFVQPCLQAYRYGAAAGPQDITINFIFNLRDLGYDHWVVRCLTASSPVLTALPHRLWC